VIRAVLTSRSAHEIGASQNVRGPGQGFRPQPLFLLGRQQIPESSERLEVVRDQLALQRRVRILDRRSFFPVVRYLFLLHWSRPQVDPQRQPGDQDHQQQGQAAGAGVVRRHDHPTRLQDADVMLRHAEQDAEIDEEPG
jgi:hypothetical protein